MIRVSLLPGIWAAIGALGACNVTEAQPIIRAKATSIASSRMRAGATPIGSTRVAAPPARPAALALSRLTLTAEPDLGTGKFTYHITPVNRSMDVGLQIFVRRDDLPNKYELIAPRKQDGTPLIISLYKGLDNTGSFEVSLPKGRYGMARLILFHAPNGKDLDFSEVAYDTVLDPKFNSIDLKLTIKAGGRRVTAPMLSVAKTAIIKEDGSGTYTVTIPATVRFPRGTKPQEGGWWVMAKSSGGFSQVWAGADQAKAGNDPDDDYQVVPIHMEMTKVKPGLWNTQFGLFTASFGDPIQWIYPGIDFEAGGSAWEVKAPAASIPPRVRVRNGKWVTTSGAPYDFFQENPAGRRAVSFVRGGNFGNAITRTISPQLNRPGYFVLLKDLGCRYMRVNFNPDRFLSEPVYQHAVDQVVQNMWTAGLYPILCPQALPEGATRTEQTENGLKVVEKMATLYKGKSVWLELCNEPIEYTTWAEWKPVAVRYTRAIRAIDPEAFVIVPFEGLSKDGRGAAKSPITEVAVDLYDGHAYVQPNEVSTLFGTAVKAGLPVLIGEYGGGADYLRKMDQALQALSPGLLAAGPWAFTILGDDQLPLVADGSRAELRLTPAGQAIANDFALWDSGKKIAP